MPLVVGVIGQFTEQSLPLRDRRFMHIDKDNFNAVMEGLSPSLSLQVESAMPGSAGVLNVSLAFKSMEDFAPERLAQQIEPLRDLLAIRGKLSDLKGRALSNEKLRDRLTEILAEQAGNRPDANSTEVDAPQSLPTTPENLDAQ